MRTTHAHKVELNLTKEQRLEIVPIIEHVADTWQLCYREEDRRKRVAAERADRGTEVNGAAPQPMIIARSSGWTKASHPSTERS